MIAFKWNAGRTLTDNIDKRARQLQFCIRSKPSSRKQRMTRGGGDTDARYQYRLTQIVLAYRMAGPK